MSIYELMGNSVAIVLCAGFLILIVILFIES